MTNSFHEIIYRLYNWLRVNGVDDTNMVKVELYLPSHADHAKVEHAMRKETEQHLNLIVSQTPTNFSRRTICGITVILSNPDKWDTR